MNSRYMLGIKCPQRGDAPDEGCKREGRSPELVLGFHLALLGSASAER